MGGVGKRQLQTADIKEGNATFVAKGRTIVPIDFILHSH